MEHCGGIEDRFFTSVYDTSNFCSISTRLKYRFSFLFLRRRRCESFYRVESLYFQGIDLENNEMDLHPSFIMIRCWIS